MRKSLVMLLASLTLALGLCPAFAFAANDAEGGLSTQDDKTVTVKFDKGIDAAAAIADKEVQLVENQSTQVEEADLTADVIYAGLEHPYTYYTNSQTLKVGDIEYKFVGWYSDADKETGFVPGTTKVTGDMTLYAKWSKKCTVTFNQNYVAAGAADAVTNKVVAWEGEAINTNAADYKAVAQTRGDYVLDGWYKDADGAGAKWLFEDEGQKKATTVSDDTVLFAKWNAQYSVTFDGNGGKTAGNAETYTQPATPASPTQQDPLFVAGTKQALAANTFVRDGYTFKEWNTKKDGGGDSYADKAEVDNLATEGGANVTLYAQWTGFPYTVQFQANTGAGTMASQSLVYGDTKLNKNTFTKKGYEFKGWSYTPVAVQTNPAIDMSSSVNVKDGAVPTFSPVPEKDGTKSLYAVWQAKNITVTFDAGEGAWANNSTEQGLSADKKKVVKTGIYEGALTAPTANPTRAGYVFDGWDTTPGDKFPDADVTYTAKWSGDSFTVSIHMNGHGGADSTQTVSNGALAEEPKLAAATGVEFKGWFADSNFETAFSFSEPITDATDVYAKWEAAKHTVTFDLNEGSWPAAKADVVNPQTIEWGNGAYYPYTVKEVEPATANAAVTYTLGYDKVEPYRIGYGFEGWYSDKEFKNKVELNQITSVTTKDGSATGVANSGTKITENTTLYAKWSKMTYQVKFVNITSAAGARSVTTEQIVDADDATKNFDQTVEYGASATKPANPAGQTTNTVGKTIDGWFTDSALTKLYDFSQPVYGNLTLYANWTDGTYTVAFDANGGKGTMGNQSIKYNAAANAQGTKLTKNAFTRDGYNFIGWSTSADTTANMNDAKYSTIETTGTGDAAVTTYPDEAAITTQITKGTTLYAVWAGPQAYTVKFDGNGNTNSSSVSDQNYTYGVTDEKLHKNTFDRDGYVFAGWNTEANGSGTAYKDEQKVKNFTENTTLYAQWAEAVTVTFNQNAAANDSTTAAQKVKKGEATALNAFSTITYNDGTNDVNFAKAGNGFKGWSTAADGTGTTYADMAEVTLSEATTLYAQWGGSAVVKFADEKEATTYDTVTVDLSKADKSVKYEKTEPKKEGDAEYDVYTFEYWTLKGDAAQNPTMYRVASDGTVKQATYTEDVNKVKTWTEGNAYTAANDVTFIAHFKGQSYADDGKTLTDAKKTYTVTFMVNGKVATTTENVTYDTSIAKPNDSYTTVEGYTFSGKWLTDEGKEFDFAKDKVKGNLTLTADMVTDQAAADQIAANEVAALIEKLPTAEQATAADKDNVDAAKAAYDKLTDAQKALLPADAVKKLEDVKAALDTADADKKAADEVAKLIADLPEADKATADDKAKADEAKAAYDKLTDDQKKLVDADAVKKLDSVVAAADAAADQKAANDVKALIDALPAADAATADDKAKADEAKAAYDKLTDAQKALVGEDVAKKLDEVSKAADAAAEQAAAEKTAEADVKAAEDAVKAAEDAQAKADEAAKTAEASKKAADEAAKSGDLAKAAEAAAKAQKDAEAAETAAKAAETAAKTAQDAAKTAADSAAKANNDDLKAKADAAQTAAGKAAETAAASVKTATDNAAAAKQAAADAQKKADDAKKSTAKKAKNTMTVKVKAVKAKAKKKTTIKKAKAFKVAKAQGKVTFKKTKGNKKITVKSNGKVVVKKGLKKGKTYKVKVKVTAAGNAKYNKITKTVTLKVKVK